jgi:N-acetylneuraminic acid mutarotase
MPGTRILTGNVVLLSVALSLSLASQAIATTGWKPVASLDYAQFAAAATAGGDGRLYLIGGERNPRVVEAFDPKTNSWTHVAHLPHGRSAPAAVEGADGRVYAISGWRPDCQCFTKEVDVYSPDRDAWTTVAPLLTKNSFDGEPATDRHGRIYVFGGYNYEHDRRLNLVEVYDPRQGAWSMAPPMAVRRIPGAAITAPNHFIYLIGGSVTHGASTTRVDRFDPRTGIWTPAAPMLARVIGFGAALGADGRIYVYGGRTPKGADSSVTQIYEPMTDTWIKGPPLPVATREAASAALGGKVYMIGGLTRDGRVASVYALRTTG